MRSGNGNADRSRRADSQALTREASLSYRRRSEPSISGTLDDIPEEVEDSDEESEVEDSDQESDTPVLDSDEDHQESLGTSDFSRSP